MLSGGQRGLRTLKPDEPFQLFSQDPRYRLRERILLGVFAVAIAVLAWKRQEIECRLLTWRLVSGVNEWSSLFKLADKGPEKMHYYVEHIDDPDPYVRYKVLLTLKAMRDDATLPHLRTRLDDPDVDVRVNAFDAMAELGAREAIPTLIEALGDDQHRIRRVAQNSLHMITGKTLDYDSNSGPEERTEAIARWEAWWSTEGSAQKISSDS